ncbi:carbohydrate esterase family 4 protein [Neolentinus lepideus HHB14362 ss-1]|uniref:chitin deacetylase n=1 Tax=Neolentinus lepideus HHB14362 ss-1 TaxID=1314782 RepID=A0A165UC21_9AGAM|nr:carbohydrate esterase family 4 protein [Neolentinus lepideus HHB14362 ss-1]
MKLQALAALLTVISATAAHEFKGRRAHLARQATSGTSAATSSASSASAAISTSGIAVSTSAAATTSAAAAPAGTYAATDVVPLSSITSGMPTLPTLPASTTYAVGASVPVSGAPALPTPFVFQSGVWPAQDKVPETDTDEVTEWLKELDGFDIPDLTPTADGSCSGDPSAAADAADRGWWTCGGHTRTTDIVACPDKMTWGVSFDDGPSPYSKTLLKYLDEKALKATFFVVGSRVIERPQILVEEYMSGHEISVHTWSHRPLTSLTNEQIVAELGWTRKAIKTILGVTPTTMRPPYGDIDDRVRAISLAMGMVPIIWTSSPSGIPFDTNDWRVAGGLVTGPESFSTFENILGNASTMNTGFIVLEHDLYQITVELATGYTLNAAMTHNPPFTLKAIGDCSKIPKTNLYRETTTNTSFPYSNTSNADAATAVKASSAAKNGSSTSGAPRGALDHAIPGLGFIILAASTVMLGGSLL